MALIDRLRRITMGRIEAFLDAVEDPEVVLPQLVREMADRVNDAANAEAKALSAVKAARRRLDEVTGRAARMGDGARLALEADDEETARQALAAQVDAERAVGRHRDELAAAEAACRDAAAVRTQLQRDLQTLQARQKELIARARAARRRRHAVGPDPKSLAARRRGLLDAVARMEAKVDEAEAAVEVHDRVTRTLGVGFETERVHALERDAEVERRLDQLKRQSAPRPTADPGAEA